MIEQKVIWTCEVCKEVYIADEGICLNGGTRGNSKKSKPKVK